jgi:hypothetical protein
MPGSNVSLDDPNLLRRCPAPTALNRCDDLNSIRRIGHRHGCMPHTAKWETVSGRFRSYLKHGIEQIRDMIVHDIRQAQQGQDKQHIVVLLHVLHHFLKAHPEARPNQHPWSRLY